VLTASLLLKSAGMMLNGKSRILLAKGKSLGSQASEVRSTGFRRFDTTQLIIQTKDVQRRSHCHMLKIGFGCASAATLAQIQPTNATIRIHVTLTGLKG
jgi:hypothetical protein